MRALVRRCFCDKERGGSFWGAGAEYEGSEARVRELRSLGYLEPAKIAFEEVAAEQERGEAEGPAPTAGGAEGKSQTPKPATKAPAAKRQPQKKPAPKQPAKKVSPGGGLRDKV